jgi:hypothetical protein
LASESWLPRPDTTDAGGRRRPWDPGQLRTWPQGQYSYIVVEEIIGDSIGLSVCAWPEVDEYGRPNFTQPSALVRVEREWVERQLAEHREPRDVADRALRIGDAFAIADIELGAGEAPPELTITSLKPPIYDISAEARTAAKTALYGALAPILDPDEAREMRELLEEPKEE